MDFDKKYPNSKLSEIYEEKLQRGVIISECEVCGKPTAWMYYYLHSLKGLRSLVAVKICGEECLEYYDIMKGVL